MSNPPTPEFLTWIADRLVNRFGESENVDFVRRLRHEAARALTLRTNLAKNSDTYVLVETGEPPLMTGAKVYLLHRRFLPGAIGSKLHLTEQQAADLSRQLDAGVDYFND